MSTKEISLGDLHSFQTNDGSISLHSAFFQENFHSLSGASKEAKEKFLKPAQLNRLRNAKRIHILDVCIGMGYNSAYMFEDLNRSNTPYQWWGLEIDPRPIHLGIKNKIFISNWSDEVREILNSIDKRGCWVHKQSKGNILWGDAREKIDFIPQMFSFDLILLDAFSPTKCPILWTEEFLDSLANKLAPGGRLITYCSAAAIRASLRRSGLELGSIIPTKQREKWSNGTIAISPTKSPNKIKQDTIWQPLTMMEEEHLLTRAAVPYRDPSGHSSIAQVLARRHKEQLSSELEDTTNWKRRWGKTH